MLSINSLKICRCLGSKSGMYRLFTTSLELSHSWTRFLRLLSLFTLLNGELCGSWCVEKRETADISKEWDSRLLMMRSPLSIMEIIFSMLSHLRPSKWNLMRKKTTLSLIGSMIINLSNKQRWLMGLHIDFGGLLYQWWLICIVSLTNFWVTWLTKITSIFSTNKAFSLQKL